MAENPASPPNTLPAHTNAETTKADIALALAGDATAIAAVRKLIRADRDAERSLVNSCGDTYKSARKAMVKFAVGQNPLLGDLITQRVDQLRAEIEGPNPSPLERILAERISLCWLEANELDRRYVEQSGISFKDAAYREGRRDGAHRRFLVACKALAQIRKLGVPAIQVNLARQQVNVANAAAPIECGRKTMV